MEKENNIENCVLFRLFYVLFSLFAECISPGSDENIPVVPHMALVSIQATSPERRFTQKEIIAGEERPKYLLIKQHQDAAAAAAATAATATAGNYCVEIVFTTHSITVKSKFKWRDL